jgi:DNA-binding ferritin-like protein
MHALLDKVVGFAREAGDGVAERAISLSYHPDDRPSAIARESILPEFGGGAIRGRQVILAFEKILDIVASWLKSWARPNTTQCPKTS